MSATLCFACPNSPDDSKRSFEDHRSQTEFGNEPNTHSSLPTLLMALSHRLHHTQREERLNRVPQSTDGPQSCTRVAFDFWFPPSRQSSCWLDRARHSPKRMHAFAMSSTATSSGWP